MFDVSDRHRSIQDISVYFAYEHLNGRARATSMVCHDLAEKMIDNIQDSDELVAGLRKLLEAKDCFVRATL